MSDCGELLRYASLSYGSAHDAEVSEILTDVFSWTNAIFDRPETSHRCDQCATIVAEGSRSYDHTGTMDLSVVVPYSRANCVSHTRLDHLTVVTRLAEFAIAKNEYPERRITLGGLLDAHPDGTVYARTQFGCAASNGWGDPYERGRDIEGSDGIIRTFGSPAELVRYIATITDAMLGRLSLIPAFGHLNNWPDDKIRAMINYFEIN